MNKSKQTSRGNLKITTPETAPDFNDALDELYGTRKAFDGLHSILACSNSDKIDIEIMAQIMQTISLRLNMCEKILKKAADAYYGHQNIAA